MRNLELARRVRGITIQKLQLNEQQEVANKGLEDHRPVGEREQMRNFVESCEGIPGIGRAGALELLMKTSTFVAIVEMELEDNQNGRRAT